MKTSRKYSVTLANGETYSFDSVRAVTHAVVVTKTPAHWSSEVRRCESEISIWEKVEGDRALELATNHRATREEMLKNLESGFVCYEVVGSSSSARLAASLAKQKSRAFIGCRVEVVEVSAA